MSAKAASKAVSTSRPFRILALPLVRLPRASSSASSGAGSTLASSSVESDGSSASSTSHHAAESPVGASANPTNPLILYQVLQPPPSAASGPPSLSARALNKASDTWLKIGDKPKDSWMYWFYSKGEALMDRIEYEEWSLKAIHEGRGVKVANKEKGEVQERIEIPLLHPQFKDAPLPTLVPKLHRMLIHRIPHHRKMMWRSILFAPVTFPFALIPVIPNFPLFYVLWRAWSHYKAYRGALYLESLLKLGMIVEKPSKDLTGIYEAVTAGNAGDENQAPDRTSTPDSSETSFSTPLPAHLAKSSPASTSSPKTSEKAQGGNQVPAQAAGKSAAPDGTTTPAEMIYPSSPSSSASGGAADTASTPQKGGKTSKARHANLLLRPNQVPLLTKAFGLTKTEIIDINRAVEQANMRANQASQAEREKAQPADQPPQGEKPGTEWRGNLHR